MGGIGWSWVFSPRKHQNQRKSPNTKAKRKKARAKEQPCTGFFGNRICGGRLFSKVSLRRHVGQQNLPKKSSKNLPKIFQNLPKILPKSSSGEGFGRLGGVLGVSWGVLGCLWVSWGRLGASCGRPWGVLGRLGSKKVANMAPTWSPKRNQNQLKIDLKSDQLFNAS